MTRSLTLPRRAAVLPAALAIVPGHAAAQAADPLAPLAEPAVLAAAIGAGGLIVAAVLGALLLNRAAGVRARAARAAETARHEARESRAAGRRRQTARALLAEIGARAEFLQRQIRPETIRAALERDRLLIDRASGPDGQSGMPRGVSADPRRVYDALAADLPDLPGETVEAVVRFYSHDGYFNRYLGKLSGGEFDTMEADRKKKAVLQYRLLTVETYAKALQARRALIACLQDGAEEAQRQRLEKEKTALSASEVVVKQALEPAMMQTYHQAIGLAPATGGGQPAPAGPAIGTARRPGPAAGAGRPS